MSEIKKLPIAIDLNPGGDVFSAETCKLAFRGEGATVKLASVHEDELRKYFQRTLEQDSFNPLA